MSHDNAQIMKEAHELAPFLADALDKLRDDLTLPSGDEREWTEKQQSEYADIVEIAEALICGNDSLVSAFTHERWLEHACAACDDALDRDQQVRRTGEW